MMRWILGWSMALGLSACLSSCDEAMYSTPGLYNRRDHPLEVIVREAKECGADVDLTDPDVYGPPRSRQLRARDVVALRNLKSLWSDSSGYDGWPAACTAVWIELPGLYEGVLKWSTWHGWDPDEDPYDHAVVVEGTRREVVVTVPKGMEELAGPGG